jgi:hypothetical protein
MSNTRACTRVDTTGRSSCLSCTAAELVSPTSFDHRSQTRWHLVDLALAFRSGVRALAMSESHVRKVIDSAAVLWSIRLRIWGSGVRISSGAPINPGTSCIQQTATTGRGNATGNCQMHWDLTTGFIAPCLLTRTARQAQCFPDNVRKHGDRVRLYIR